MGRQFQFCEFTLDELRYKLLRGDRPLRLQKQPMDLLILLVERRGELVSRYEIAQHLWGKDVFVDVDHSINTAVRKLRQALRDDPEKPRYVETVLGKGYRFAAPVICRNGDATPQLEVGSLPSPVQVHLEPATPIKERRQVPAREWIVIGATAFLVLIAAAVALYPRRVVKPPVQPPIKSLAVLPLKNLSGDPAQEYLADGMTEALIGRLASIRDLRVISRTSVMRYKETKLSVPEIAKALGVDAIVEGSVIRDGNRVRVHAQLIRAASDEHFWAQEYDRELQTVLVLQGEIAQSIANKVQASVTGQERAKLVAARAVAPEVYEIYLKGVYVPGNSKAAIEKSIAYFQEAIQRDPTFAPAYVDLAGAYYGLGTTIVGGSPAETRPKAITAAQKALELDPSLVIPHVLLGYLYQARWQWKDAENEFKRALELGPNDAVAHHGYARWLLSRGRIDEALAWQQRARELDPLGNGGGEVAWILFHARRYDEAIREARMELQVNPDSGWAQWVLSFALICNGQPDEAIPIMEELVPHGERQPGDVALLATAHARAGNRTEALRLIEELNQRRRKGYVPAGAFVNTYLGLEEYDQAFLWFEEAYREQSQILQYLKVHPLFDAVRNDPRFIDLQRRVGLD